MRKYLFMIPVMVSLFFAAAGWQQAWGGEGLVPGKPYQLSLNGLRQTILIHANNSANPVLLVFMVALVMPCFH
ncbi:hypothetical protein FE236_13410 [Mariprofundus erugo]|uniref:hypothetical protein n=1 Tax=Mariprofundus erugo TaxID=2528639 RepID=UPI0010FEB805|nr:hypothetical protein [Mariprofundus erugo]TLS72804.1 hypothetical protein FE236_13410 [Mariprofundus erugo]